MNEKPMVIGVDFGSKDSTAICAIRREGVKLIYTLAEGETLTGVERGFVVCHPDRPPKLVTPDGIEEISP